MGYIRRGYAKSRPALKRIKHFSLLAALISFILSIIIVILFKWLPVYFTPLVFLRAAENALDGKWTKAQKTWVSIDQISPYLQKAVIASEDPKFLLHSGFDYEAIGKAIHSNKKRKVKVGASTISQQTAKNVFLYPSRTYLRKGLEAYFTILIETFWSKRRILEVYLNIIELGPGIYGAEAASQHFYKKAASKLSAGEAHLFAAILPNPRVWDPKRPTNFILRRRKSIQRNLTLLGSSYFEPLMVSL
jgi:monofunctional glycosyltransferase